MTVAPDAELSTRPYFVRPSVRDNIYSIDDMTQFGRPAAAPPLVALARYTVDGVLVEAREVVRRREPKLPYGDVLRELRIVPALSVSVAPGAAVVPLAAATRRVPLQVEVLNNHEGAIDGELLLALPSGWTSEPERHTLSFSRAGEKANFAFSVSVPALESRAYTVEAVATGSRALLAIDDLPFYTGDSGDIVWEMISVLELQRVETIKGAASSLYGSSAIGGVINSITRDISEKPLTIVNGFYGIYDRPYYSEWDWSGERRPFNGLTLSHSQRIEKFGFDISLTRLEESIQTG